VDRGFVHGNHQEIIAAFTVALALVSIFRDLVKGAEQLGLWQFGECGLTISIFIGTWAKSVLMSSSVHVG
jgi:hypothetical protein